MLYVPSSKVNNDVIKTVTETTLFFNHLKSFYYVTLSCSNKKSICTGCRKKIRPLNEFFVGITLKIQLKKYYFHIRCIFVTFVATIFKNIKTDPNYGK